MVSVCTNYECLIVCVILLFTCGCMCILDSVGTDLVRVIFFRASLVWCLCKANLLLQLLLRAQSQCRNLELKYCNLIDLSVCYLFLIISFTYDYPSHFNRSSSKML